MKSWYAGMQLHSHGSQYAMAGVSHIRVAGNHKYVDFYMFRNASSDVFFLCKFGHFCMGI